MDTKCSPTVEPVHTKRLNSIGSGLNVDACPRHSGQVRVQQQKKEGNRTLRERQRCGRHFAAPCLLKSLPHGLQRVHALSCVLWLGAGSH